MKKRLRLFIFPRKGFSPFFVAVNSNDAQIFDKKIESIFINEISLTKFNILR
jgi:hypothetical protein